jgi:manganese/zinc/iron transport system permease protein
MQPYLDQGFFPFIASLWGRAFLFLVGALSPDEMVCEDLQFLALIASGLIGLFLGFYLIYNRLTMVANSLSHNILLGLILTYFIARWFWPVLSVDCIPLGLQLVASVVSSLLTLLSLKFLSKKLSFEASNALSFTMFFALAILLSSLLLNNTHLGLESVLGNLEALAYQDIQRLFWVLCAVIVFVSVLKTRLNVTSFDALFARSLGIGTEGLRQALIFMSSLSLMVCFRSMGVILILSLLTSPVLIARLFYQSRRKIFILGALVVAFQITVVMGLVQWLYVSYELPVSTGGLFGFMGLVNYLIALFFKSKKVLFKR